MKTRRVYRPSSTVVSETTAGQSPAVGVAPSFSRGDHTHGTPSGGGGPSPSATVADETSFGIAPAAGAAAAYSRGDHTHGTPPAKSIPAAGDTVTGPAAFGDPSAAGASGDYSRKDHSHGLPAAPVGGGGVAWYGDGRDGDVTISADTHLTRDMYYNNLTIAATKVLYADGSRIFVKGTLTFNAGGNAYIYTQGGKGGAGGGAGAAGPGGYLPAGVVGGSGQPGSGNPGNSTTNARGGNGGKGGDNIGGRTGGAAGTVTAPTAAQGGADACQNPVDLLTQYVKGQQINSSASGGGGAGDGSNSGAGGGGTPSALVIAARHIVSVSEHDCGIIGLGGEGGDPPAFGNRAGGGGGGGPLVGVITDDPVTVMSASMVKIGADTTITYVPVYSLGGRGGNGIGIGDNGVAGDAGPVVAICNA